MRYSPDESWFTKGALFLATSFVPTTGGFYQTSAPPVTESAISLISDVGDSIALGASILENTGGTKKLFAGSPKKLWQWTSVTGGWGWVNRSSTNYGTPTAGFWSFAQFGDFHLAANGVERIQACTSGNFADIGSTAPRAKFVLVHENAVVALNIAGNPAGWARSDTGNHTQWTAAGNNDADSGVLYGGVGGPITAATVFGNLAIAWKSSAMYAGQFIGSDEEKMRWTFIDPKVGCVGPQAWTATDAGLIFVSQRDVMIFDGTRPRSITDGVRRTLFALMSADRSNAMVSHDEAEKVVYIWFPLASGLRPYAGLSYNYSTGKWGGAVLVGDNVAYGAGQGSIDCIVQNVSYYDYQAVGGMGSNSFGQAHVVMARFQNIQAGSLTNFAHQASPATRNNQPSLLTGLLGDFFTDSIPNKVYVIQDDASLNKTPPSSILVTPYSSPAVSGAPKTAAINSDGYGDIQVSTRLGSINVNWPVSTGQIAVGDLVLNPTAGGKR